MRSTRVPSLGVWVAARLATAAIPPRGGLARATLL